MIIDVPDNWPGGSEAVLNANKTLCFTPNTYLTTPL